MPSNLDQLPFDILFNLAGYLEVEDVVHLRHTSRQLHFSIHEDSLFRKLLEVRVQL